MTLGRAAGCGRSRRELGGRAAHAAIKGLGRGRPGRSGVVVCAHPVGISASPPLRCSLSRLCTAHSNFHCRCRGYFVPGDSNPRRGPWGPHPTAGRSQSARPGRAAASRMARHHRASSRAGLTGRYERQAWLSRARGRRIASCRGFRLRAAYARLLQAATRAARVGSLLRTSRSWEKHPAHRDRPAGTGRPRCRRSRACSARGRVRLFPVRPARLRAWRTGARVPSSMNRP